MCSVCHVQAYTCSQHHELGIIPIFQSHITNDSRLSHVKASAPTSHCFSPSLPACCVGLLSPLALPTLPCSLLPPGSAEGGGGAQPGPLQMCLWQQATQTGVGWAVS